MTNNGWGQESESRTTHYFTSTHEEGKTSLCGKMSRPRVVLEGDDVLLRQVGCIQCTDCLDERAMLNEYDFSKGIRGKYTERYGKGEEHD